MCLIDDQLHANPRKKMKVSNNFKFLEWWSNFHFKVDPNLFCPSNQEAENSPENNSNDSDSTDVSDSDESDSGESDSSESDSGESDSDESGDQPSTDPDSDCDEDTELIYSDN